jgi:hypothetical protein
MIFLKEASLYPSGGAGSVFFGAIVQASSVLHIFRTDPPFPFLAPPLSKSASLEPFGVLGEWRF